MFLGCFYTLLVIVAKFAAQKNTCNVQKPQLRAA